MEYFAWLDRRRVGCLNGFLKEGIRESRRRSRDTYSESSITENILVYEEKGESAKHRLGSGRE
jgi:hypothetical protein